MSLKAINESYRALSAQALRLTVVAHIKIYRRQMVATVLAVESFCGSVTIGGRGFWWQCYYRGEHQMVTMQRKEFKVYFLLLISN